MSDPSSAPSSIAVFAGKKLEELLRLNNRDVKWLADWLKSQDERTGLNRKRDKNTIYRWQSGVNCLPPEFADLIGRRFGLPASWFYGDTSPVHSTLVVFKGDSEQIRLRFSDDVRVVIETERINSG